MVASDPRFRAASRRRFHEAQETWDHFIDLLLDDPHRSLRDLLNEIGRSESAYQKRRANRPDFAGKVDAIRAKAKGQSGKPRSEWDGGFASFRKIFFGFDSPWFHLEIVRALETSNPGDVIMILLHPLAGKTTLLEDWVCFKLATDPACRITYASETPGHAQKAVGRVQRRMMKETGPREFVERFGPFEPPQGRRTNQTWTTKQFNVFRKDGDERDYSMQALSFNSKVAGTRCDLLIADDMQSVQTANQTEHMIEVFRQDWLSRPGPHGVTVVIGTRVADDDVYARLEDSGLLAKVIRYPAYRPDQDTWPAPDTTVHNPAEHPVNLEPAEAVSSFLWPERYSPADYLRMRISVGEEAWARNYMQAPRVPGTGHFDRDMINANLNPLRKCAEPCPDTWKPGMQRRSEIVATLDPGFGTNAWMVAALTRNTIGLLDWRVDHNLPGTEQIFAFLADYCREYHVGHVVIEDKAFQKGLLTDRSLRDLQKQFGFSVSGHQTGENKMDADLGIPQMVRSFMREDFDIPAGDDRLTTHKLALLTDQLVAWRPHKRGNVLVQDLVITLWFAWMRWMNVAESFGEGHTTDIRTSALPFKPISVPLSR